MTTFGIVAIGRNEGDRLKRCLESVRGLAKGLVYVDSGSTDDSLVIAKSCAATVLELDLRTPFTAARARNEGFQRLMQLQPDLDYVFFVDGDCEVVSGWLEKARQFLDQHEDVAVVAGLRRERFPEKSIYNLLIDIEWREYPFGDVRICGGDALIRVTALEQVKGYRADLICGEEPEMCFRLRQAGWRIWRMHDPMALHDAAMYRFGQWWTRAVRGGYASALGASIHGASSERHWILESSRPWLWALGIPLVTFVLVAAWGWWGLLLLAIYPLQVARLARRSRQSARENWWRGAALVVGKFPEVVGQFKFISDRIRGARTGLIEYK
jgi:GT2 family glycosyltransferase